MQTKKPQRPTAALAAVLLIAAAAGPGAAGAQGNGPCNSGVCKLDVTVQSCEDGTLGASRDPLVVPAPNNIEWTLATAGYQFAVDGIAINGSGFTNRPGVNGNGRKFTVHDAWTDRGRDIKYAIKVIRRSDGYTCKVWDPVIRNG